MSTIMESPPSQNLKSPRVGLIYDERMCRHDTPDGERHPESPLRIKAIWKYLESQGITKRCVILDAKEADDNQLAFVHTKQHIDLMRNISSKQFDSRRIKIASKFNSIYFNKGSSEAAYLAAGSVIEASISVASGNLTSAVAIVRPPGHHAEENAAMGFCLFNNVAVAANVLLNEKPELDIKKILIVDWDVHHGNGTQNAFYRDPRVLYFSVHRFDFGSFYPSGGDGSHCMTGEDEGAGYNINVPWEHGRCGDADYIAVWDHVLIPVAEAYDPDIILVSAGFDAALGDPLGGCCITPVGYSVMLQKLMRFAGGKIMMALEGGYNIDSISKSVFACVKTLIEEKPLNGSIEGRPFESTWRVIKEVRNELKVYWSVLRSELPHDLLRKNQPVPVEPSWISSSDSDVENDEEISNPIGHTIHAENVDAITLPLMALNIDAGNHEKAAGSSILTSDQLGNCAPWRSNLSKIEVWYASYGSNMWKDRFLCYIQGGKVEGMNMHCSGSSDKSLPRDVIWKVVPHKLFFARSSSHAWGKGGVAFLNSEIDDKEKAFMCLYRITLEQFNDILLLENYRSLDVDVPLVDIHHLDYLARNKTMIVDCLKDGWYSTIVLMGKEDNIPILTMTCSSTAVDKCKSGEIPMCAPAKEYANTLVEGLVGGNQLTREQAIEYIQNAVSTGL